MESEMSTLETGSGLEVWFSEVRSLEALAALCGAHLVLAPSPRAIGSALPSGPAAADELLPPAQGAFCRAAPCAALRGARRDQQR